MKKAVMYGAGNIGRGFIGQLFSKSGYEVVFIDINPVVIDKLNEDNCYPVRIVGNGEYREETVNNVRAVNAADMDAVADEIVSADIMATSVGVNVLPKITAPIAYALKKRWERNNIRPLNIIICENLLDANHYLAKLIKKEMDENQQKLFGQRVGLVEASIGRMVPVMTHEMQQGNPLRVYVEEYCKLPVDRDAFKGEIPEIANMIPFSPFDYYIQRKLFMHNMGHATTAYLGFVGDCKYIWEACRNSTIKLIVLRALQESSIAMSKEHDVPLEELLGHSDNLIYRFGNKLLGDTVERVGKDPVRKLSQNDRLTGAAKLCIKHGITPVYISLGIAAGFLFAPEQDNYAQEIQDFIKQHGIKKAIEKYCSLTDSNDAFKMAVDFYNELEEGEGFQEVLSKAESLKDTSNN